MAWLLVQPRSGLDAGDAAVVRRIEQDDTARTITGLASRFTALVRAAGKGNPTQRLHLDPPVDRRRGSGIRTSSVEASRPPSNVHQDPEQTVKQGEPPADSRQECAAPTQRTRRKPRCESPGHH